MTTWTEYRLWREGVYDVQMRELYRQKLEIENRHREALAPVQKLMADIATENSARLRDVPPGGLTP